MSKNYLIPLEDYEKGLFVYEDELCFKNEYNEAFIVWSGEFFCPKDVLILPISDALVKVLESTGGKIYKQFTKNKGGRQK